MRELTPTQEALFSQALLKVALLVKLEPNNLPPVGFTNHDKNVVLDGVLYSAELGMTPAQTEAKAGGSVSNTDFVGIIDSESLSDALLDAGAYDGAFVTVSIYDWGAKPDTALTVLTGYLGAVERGEHAFTAEVRSLATRINQELGNYYGRLCRVPLGSPECGIDLANFTSDALVSSRSGTRVELEVADSSGFAETADFYARGFLEVQGGKYDQVRWPISEHSGSVIILSPTPPRDDFLAPGDLIALTAGCRKTTTACSGKFGNIVNFRGFPHMVGDDFLTRYPNKGEANDGTPIVR